MERRRTSKVVCYVVREGHLLVLTHRDVPLVETGVQVPAGTIRPGEDPAAAALREAQEETGLADLRLVRALGEADYDISPYRHEVMHRFFYELTTDCRVSRRWECREPDPDGGGDGPVFECSWIPLAQAHVLAAGLGAMVGRLGDPGC